MDLLDQLAASGVELWFEGERLRFRAPKGALTPERRTELSAQREALLAELRSRASGKSSVLPMSFSQRSLWFLHQQAPESTAYHVALSARVRSPLQAGALKQAVQALVDRHSILRTGYELIDGVPSQRIAGAAVADFEVHSVAGCTEEALREAVTADYRRPFDLDQASVLRASLYSRGDADHVLLLTVHHIAVDGWSLFTLLEELLKLYEEFIGGPPASLPKPALQYADYSTWQEQMLAGEEGEKLWAFWRAKLAEPRTDLVLPTDGARPSEPGTRGASYTFSLPTALLERIKSTARAEGATPFVVLLAAFHAFLHKLTGSNDVIVGTPTFARSKPQFEQIVGDFVNPLPVRASVSGELSWRALIAQLRETMHGVLENQEFPLPLLVERLQPQRDRGRTPLFGTFFILQRFDQFREMESLLAGDESSGVVERGSLRLAPYLIPQQEGQFDLALQMVERSGVLHAVFKYSAEIFKETTLSRWAADYVKLVEVLLDSPASPIADAPRVYVPQPPVDAAALLDRLAGQDIRLFLEGDKLRVNAPKGAVDDAMKATIAAHKDELIAALKTRASAGGGRDGGIAPLPRTGELLPVSSVQQRLWFLDRMMSGRPEYNIGLGFRFVGKLDESCLRRALDLLVSRQESLRMRIIDAGGSPAMELLPEATATVVVNDIQHLDAQARAVELRRLHASTLAQSFDMGTGPLCRFVLVRMAPEEHVLIIGMHHAASDGWSLVIAVDEICRLYEALAAGRAPQVRALPIQYADYAAWEREQLHSGRLAKQLTYWKRQLAGAPTVLEIPLDRPRPATQSFRGARLKCFFDAKLLQDLKDVSRKEGATLFMTLLAAWQVLLHRYSGQEEVMVGTPVANRSVPALEGLIGCLVNNVVLRGSLAGNPRFRDYLARMKQVTLDAFEHSELPFDVVVEGVNPQRSASHALLFQVLFTFMSFPTRVAPPAGFATEFVDGDIGTARYDITIEMVEQEGQLRADYEYATDLFDQATILRMHEHFRTLLAAVAADTSTPIRDLPLLSTAEQRQILEGWNATGVEHDRSRCVHNLLERTARERPNAPAVRDEHSTLTFAELDRRANQLAQLLCEKGIERGALVGVCLDRTVDMPVALAAVLKCGAAYVPLDPTHPADRLKYTLEDAGVFCVITLSRFADKVADAKAPLIALDELQEHLATRPATAPAVACTPDDLAYVIYTSGSTGRPKGVQVEHRNVVAFLEAMRREPGLTADDVLLAVTTLSFDIAGLEMWLPLMVGAQIYVASRTDVLDGHRLAELMETHDVTLLQATPATWRLLLEAGWRGRQSLKVLCGGEAFPRDLAAQLLERVGEVWNVYGPTETTIWSTVYRVRDPQTIPVGHGIANTRVYVLEPSGAPAPIGVAGELCIGGEGVARGYRNRPELTTEKFTTITLSNGVQERVYRTGDMARWRADGELDFLGRRDTQVKVRGYRIELGEIEAVLGTHVGVKECVVVVREDVPGDQRLVGYVVTAAGMAFDAEAARVTLREKLPEYMIPNLFMTLSALPLTPNGKIDRKMLPVPKEAKPQADAAGVAAEALMTPAQRRVAALWREVLRLDRVGLHDNFFDLGGHSLLLVKLQAALKRDFGRDLPLVDLFQRTTVSAQAGALAAPAGSGDALKRAQARAVKQVNV